MLNFLGIGAQKAGTTWLYEMLSRHPAIRFPGGKEVHFWDVYYSRGIPWYQQLFQGDDRRLIKGDITPAYAILPVERIRLVHQTFPGIRLIYLIRNPVERAWSSALMALQRAEMELDEASDQWFIDHFQSLGSRSRGDYASCIRNWREIYPAEQLLIASHEELSLDPRRLLQRVCTHIGIDEHPVVKLPSHTLQQRSFSGPGHPLRPSLRPLLEEIYREPQARLRQLLGTGLPWDP